jgi:serine protease Do
MTKTAPASAAPRYLPAACLIASLVLAFFSALAWSSDLRRTAIVVAVEKARPSVVNIHGKKTLIEAGGDAYGEERRVNGMGTGVVIDHRGYILTNYHVIEGVSRIQIEMADGQHTIAQLVARDVKTDLAVIKIPVDGPLPVITLGTSSDLMLGEPVIAVGNAYGYPHTVTNGIISSLKRSVEVSDTQKYDDLIQTNAAINPGNSGGPLLNIDGEMIGVNAAVRVGAQNIGFAIPVDKAIAVASNLLSSRNVSGTWHGIRSETVHSPSQIHTMVEGAISGSPAEEVGLKNGDVVVSVNGKPVERSLDIETALIGLDAGQEVPLTVQRDGEPVELVLTLAKAPDQSEDVNDRAWDALGLRLSPISSAEFRRYRTNYRGGLRVASVRVDSAADEQGIRKGDVLVGMHVWETISMENVAYILNHSPEVDQPMKFFILRGKDTLYGHLPVTLR